MLARVLTPAQGLQSCGADVTLFVPDFGSEKENDANNTGNPEIELLKRWNETEASTVCVSVKTTKRIENLSCNPEKGGRRR